MPDDANENRLIIDSDWKSEAQAEKERLDKESQEHAAGQGQQQGMPEPDFRGLVGMIASQALMYLGAVADPSSGKAMFDPVYARHMIDLLSVLEEKTKGNLTDEEATELSEILRELRSRFVEIARAVAQQQSGQNAPNPTDSTQGPGPAGPAGPVMPG